MRFRVIDIETTGLAPPAEIIEIGCVDVVIDAGGIVIEPPRTQLYRPLHGISPETMAVHHITERDFLPDTPVCTEDHLRAAVLASAIPDAFVAHNCEFEQRFIPGHVTSELPWICTHKIALRVWPNAPRHSNQVLRYWRQLTLDANLAMPPHRAGPDAWVTAHIFAELIQTASAADMIDWTLKPKQLPAPYSVKGLARGCSPGKRPKREHAHEPASLESRHSPGTSGTAISGAPDTIRTCDRRLKEGNTGSKSSFQGLSGRCPRGANRLNGMRRTRSSAG